MALTPGTRLGAYEIVSLLGAGGMGEVYRASDTKLDRDVALKILPEAFTTDAERLSRFRREAQVLASLNHPCIGAIYGFDEANGQQFLVLELVEGESLDKRIARGPVAVDEALAIAKQIAEALEAAHEKGIIHRDLKPANIALTHDGGVKVLDFGLAKAAERAGGTSIDLANSPTVTSPAMMTGVGVILGTAAYMSPEQAKGRPADKRSDVWSFGCILFEMLAGQRAFDGEDVSETLAAVLRGQPDWALVPRDLSSSIRAVIDGCLTRDRQRRIRDVSTAAFLLDRAETYVQTAATPGTATLRSRSTLVWFTGITVTVVALAVASVWWPQPSRSSPVTRFVVPLPEGQSFVNLNRHTVAISPDGSLIAYAANRGLYIRSMSDWSVQPVRGSDTYSVSEPAFSPDGKSIVFYSPVDRTLKRIPTTGGGATTLCPAEIPFGVRWDADTIVFAQGSGGIMRVSANGGTPEQLVRLKADELAEGPQILPDGDRILFSVAHGMERGNWDRAQVVVQSLGTGERQVLVQGGSDGRYLATGHLVYASGGVLFAAPLDLRRMTLRGSATPVVEGVRRTAVGGNTGAANYSISSNGSLVYIPGAASTSIALPSIALINRNGDVGLLKAPPGDYRWPRVSPDGKQLAVNTDDGKEAAIWLYDLSGRTAIRRLTFGGNSRYAVWTPDSKRVVFQSDRENDRGIYWQNADGTGGAERLTKASTDEAHVPESSHGDMLLFANVRGPDVSLWKMSLRDKKPSLFDTVHSVVPTNAAYSPDGRWVAYAARTAQSSTTIYVQPASPDGSKYAISATLPDNPHHPMWRPDGRELFFDPRAGAFQAVAVSSNPTFAFGNAIDLPRPFMSSGDNSRRAFDITPDGQFLGLVEAGTDTRPAFGAQINVILNWFEELKARVPTK